MISRVSVQEGTKIWHFLLFILLILVSSCGGGSGSWDPSESPSAYTPSAPTGVSISTGDRQLTLSWQSVLGADSYNVYWSTSPGVTRMTGQMIPNANSPLFQTGLTNGTTYYYVITSVNDYGESAESSEVAAAPPVQIMPLGDSITAGNSSCANPDDEDHWVSYRKALWDRLVGAGYNINYVGSMTFGGAVLGDPDNEGHGGWCADGCYSSNILSAVYGFLVNNPADVVLLHIGTNDLDAGSAYASEVSAILDEIYRYGRDWNRNIWVILALIIHRTDPPCTLCPETASYNNAVRQMAQSRIQSGDRIVLVDMENGAGIDYRLYPAGDMCDGTHPYATGYQKMANVWFNGFHQIF